MANHHLPPDWQVERAHIALAERIDWSHAFLGANEDWYKADCSEIKVGVLDTGYTDHPDLRGAVAHSEDCTGGGDSADYQSHGSWCLGAIGANANDIGVRGIAAGCKLYSLKVLNDQGIGTDNTISTGIRRASELGVDIISMSLGGPSMGEGVLTRVRQFLSAKPDGAVFAAAGNAGRGTRVGYPGRWPECQAIAAIDQSGALTSFASYEPDIVTCCAPGYQMLSTIPGGYGLMSGSSMSAPIAAGIAAKILARHRAIGGGKTPLTGPASWREHIQRTATKKGDLMIINPMKLLEEAGVTKPSPPPGMVCGAVVLQRWGYALVKVT